MDLGEPLKASGNIRKIPTANMLLWTIVKSN